MTVKIKEFLEELDNYGIKIDFNCGRIKLYDGNEEARVHYQRLIESSPKFEYAMIYDLMEIDADIRYAVEERAAIREFDAGLSGDIESAIKCNLAN